MHINEGRDTTVLLNDHDDRSAATTSARISADSQSACADQMAHADHCLATSVTPLKEKFAGASNLM